MALTDIDGQRLGDSVGDKLGNRNLIINGAMNVAQRGTSFTSTSSGYKLDGFRFGDSSPGVFDVVQSSTAPAGFSNSFKVDCTTAVTPSGTEEMFVETKIEAQDLQHLQFGTSGAQSVTLSFHVKSNKTGSYGLWVYQDDAASQYATTYTISSANTWEYKTITIPGNTASAINDDNGTGLVFRFYLLSGSAYAGTPTETWTTTLTNRTTSLNLGDDTANEWLITGVQLEVGNTATPFEHRSYGDELRRCQRYYQSFDLGKYGGMGLIGRKSGSNTVEFDQIVPFGPMRTTPTGSWTGDVTGFQLTRLHDATTVTPTGVTISGRNANAFTFLAATTSFTTANAIGQLSSGTSSTQSFELISEL